MLARKDGKTVLMWVQTVERFLMSSTRVRAAQVMLGENGTGKTTFIRMLAGALDADKAEGDIPQFRVSYKPQKISPKFPGSVSCGRLPLALSLSRPCPWLCAVRHPKGCEGGLGLFPARNQWRLLAYLCLADSARQALSRDFSSIIAVSEQQLLELQAALYWKGYRVRSKSSSTVLPRAQVRELLHKRIRDSYLHPQFNTDVMKPLNIEALMDQQARSAWLAMLPHVLGRVIWGACMSWQACVA